MDTTNDFGEGSLGPRRPACDNCKSRKTKCDRKSPCASCVTLQVSCHVTRRAPEKRQRVLLSSKYDEAMQNVDSRLDEISSMLQKLVMARGPQESRMTSASLAAHEKSRAMITDHLPEASGDCEGFEGDSSFNAHVKKTTAALEATFAAQQLSSPEYESPVSFDAVHEMLQDVEGSQDATAYTADEVAPGQSSQLQPLDLGELALPPMEPVLKLLRLIRTEKHVFFVDIPIVDEQDVTDSCRKVYFVTEPYSILTWSIVNTGLFYLFLGLREHHLAQIDVTAADVESYMQMLTANINAACQSLRLCLKPSVLACRAVALLASFLIRSGRASLAWRLMSVAARMCLDLGLHRLPRGMKGRESSKNRMLFWYVYCMDKCLAFNFGRSSTIHHYDVSSERPDFAQDLPGVPGRLYGTYLEYAILSGDIHQHLFSASALQNPQHVRIEYAKRFSARLNEIQGAMREVSRDETGSGIAFPPAVTLDIVTSCLLTIIYRIIPPDTPDPHPLQCCNDCIMAARDALSMLVRFGQEMKNEIPGWTLLLNLMLSFTPFVSFIVLVGNSIATSSRSDIPLLLDVISVIEPVTKTSPAVRKLHHVCQKFYRIADLTISQQASGDQEPSRKSLRTDVVSGSSRTQHSLSEPMDTTFGDYGFPMSLQDWDDVMRGFELDPNDVDAGALATLVEPYMVNGSASIQY